MEVLDHQTTRVSETTNRPLSRVTLKFSSDSGAEYLYDDSTGSIFPWGQFHELILNRELGSALTDSERAVLKGANAAEIDAITQLIRRWLTQYGAFVRQTNHHFPVPTTEQVRDLVLMNCYELVLMVTENCDMRCKYCVYSDKYPYNRLPSKRAMDASQAVRIVDWFVDCMSPSMNRNPRKTYSLCFFGGEPLLNFPVIRDVLNHVRKQYPDLFHPTITTNGLLLKPEIVKVLAERRVQINVSMDGPQAEHDRLRVDTRGQGTHHRIILNLSRLKQQFPQYCAEQVRILSVYDARSNVEDIAEYFQNSQEDLPALMFVTMVNNHNSSYYSQFAKEDFVRLGRSLSLLRARFKKAKINGQPLSNYLFLIGGFGAACASLRPGIADKRTVFLPYTGACIPGSRLTVQTDGAIDMCERVNGTCPIGHFDKGGLDYKRIAEIIGEYQNKAMQNCSTCAATRLCSQCFAYAETKGGFASSPALCASILYDAKQNLSDYVSVMEANSNAAFQDDVRRLKPQNTRLTC